MKVKMKKQNKDEELKITKHIPALTYDRKVHFKSHKFQQLKSIHVRQVHISDYQVKLVYVFSQHSQCRYCFTSCGYCNPQVKNK